MPLCIWKTRIKEQELSGFTLLELLITTSLIALMGLAIYSTFARGVTVWQRGSKTNITEQEARFTLENLAKEVKNSFKLSGIGFSGTKEQISFPTYINTADIAEMPRWEVGRVSYFFDSDKKSLFRRQENYVDLFQPDEPEAKKVISQVNSLEISYYYFDYKLGTYKWMDSWSNKEEFPFGVRIELTTLTGKEEQKFVKTVYLVKKA